VPVPRFRIRTLMIAVAVFGLTFAVLAWLEGDVFRFAGFVGLFILTAAVVTSPVITLIAADWLARIREQAD